MFQFFITKKFQENLGGRTQFVMLAHTPRDEKSHRPEAELVVAHSPHLLHSDSVGVNLLGSLPPTAEHQPTSH